MSFLSFLNKKTVPSTKPEVIVKTPSFRSRMENMIAAGFTAKCVFDCGASVGMWSLEISKMFPGAQIVAIEPNAKVLPEAKQTLIDVQPSVIIEECALSDHKGEAFFNVFLNDDGTKMSASSLKDHVHNTAETKLKVQLDTLDNICEKHQLVPDLIKLDLQGGELDALKGAYRILETTEVVVSEFGCLPAYIDRTTPHELMQIMYEHDYCLYDIIDLLYRPYDNALAGGDFIFVKNDSNLKNYKGFC